MATGKLYDDRPYETEFSAEVLEVKKAEEPLCWNLVLDQTLFFPEEGGQSPDRGEIVIDSVTYEVVDVSIQDEIITHKIRGTEEKAPAGERAEGRIYWQHRYSNMQNHTGEHIFSGLVHAQKGYDNVGFHLSDRVVTMDYNGPLTEEEILEVTREANRVIARNLPVNCAYPTEEELSDLEYRSKKEISGKVRIVTIPGVDVCACCAPHVRSTAEVGLLMVVGAQNYKGGTRLSILCGMRAVADYQLKQNVLSLTGRNLSTSWENIPEAVDKLKRERDNFRYQTAALSGKLLEAEAKELPPGENACLFTACTDRNVLIKVVDQMKQQYTGLFVIFSTAEGLYDPKEARAFSYVGASVSGDSRRLSECLKAEFGAKGGGKPQMVQGSVFASETELRKLIDTGLVSC